MNGAKRSAEAVGCKNASVGERSALGGSTRVSGSRRSGSENVGLSNANIGENPVPQKPKGSSARVRRGRENAPSQCSSTRRYGAEVTHAILPGKARTTFNKRVPVPETYTDQCKAINDEGMPMYQRPFMRGKLYIHFTVDFPDSLAPEQCKALEAVLPSRASVQLTDMELDECEETTLYDVNIEEEMRRKQAQAAQEAYEEDDDMHGGAQRVQCAQQ
ncbi:hypothetical protein GOBAR_DD32370 [Gossypium barbadense]|nr:hypothetical protein GOBAR_DD32370 [Gossypium barbadense]